MKYGALLVTALAVCCASSALQAATMKWGPSITNPGVPLRDFQCVQKTQARLKRHVRRTSMFLGATTVLLGAAAWMMWSGTHPRAAHWIVGLTLASSAVGIGFSVQKTVDPCILDLQLK